MADVEMVERVKAALIAEDESVGGTRHAAYWGDLARAAIEALREPTFAMRAAVLFETAEEYPAMIDAILKED